MRRFIYPLKALVFGSLFLISSCNRDIRPKPSQWVHSDYKVTYDSSTGNSYLIHTDPQSGTQFKIIDFRLEKLGANDDYIKVACSDYNSIYFYYIELIDGKVGSLSSGLTGDELEEVESKLNLPPFTWSTN